MKSETRVLLVEDNPGDARMVEMWLEESTLFRFRVQKVDRLSQAREAVDKDSFDVILLDLGLPDSQGIDTVVRMNQVAPTTAIIVLTGLSDNEVALRAVQRGAQDYLVKGEIDTWTLTRSLRYAVERKRIEEVLRQSDERFQLANRATFNAIWDWNLQTNAIWWNENFQTLFGYRAEEIEASIESWTNRIHPEDLDRVTVGVHAAIDSGRQSWSGQYRFRRKDGTYAEIDDRGYIVREASGKPVRMIGAMDDITERKRAEADLVTSKALLSETERIGKIGGWAFDAETLTQTWTEETFRILEIDLTNGEPKVPEGIGFIAPAFRPMAEQAIQRAIEFGEPYDQEWEIITTKGKRRWVRAVATAHQEQGKTKSVSGSFQDITERKQSEERLRETKEYLKNLLDYANAPIIVWSPDFIIAIFNHAFERLTGMSSEQMVGKPLETLFPEETKSDSMAFIRQTAVGARWEDVEIPVRGEDGSTRTVLWNSATLTNPDGEAIATIAQGQDITERKRAEESLRESEKRYRLLVDCATEAILVAQDGMLRLVNPMAVAMTGFSEQELLSRPFTSFIHPDDRAMVVERHQKRLRGEAVPARYAFRLLAKDGSIKWVEIGAVTIEWEGRPATLNFLMDITVRKRAELELASAQVELKEAHRLAHIGTWDWLIENDTVTWSEELFDIAGRDPSLPAPTYAEHPRHYTPTSWVSLSCAVDRALTTGEPYNLELDMVRPDGSIRKIDAIGSVKRDNKGKIIGLHGMVQDVTERKRAEEALSQAKDVLEVRVIERTRELRETNSQLQEEKDKLAVMLRSIGDGVIATDEQGVVVLLNRVAEELTGWRNDDAFGLSLHKVFHIINESTKEECLDVVERVISAGGITGLANHTSLIAKDGQVRSIADSGAPIMDVGGRIVGVIIVFRDVTAQRIMEEEAEKSLRLESIGLLAGGIAHDFNNILTGILGDISLAKMYAKSGDKVHERLSDAELTLSHAKGLAQQLLTFSRGGAPIKRGTSVRSLLSDSVNFALSGSNVRHVIEVDPDIWSVDVDQIQMVQAFNNILINAREAMPQGGIIRLRGKNVAAGRGGAHVALPSDKDFVIVSFTDNGKGIPKASLSKVFDPYFTTKPKGGGLGLSIVHSIVKRHDGFTSVESEEGKGAKFTIFLPARKEPLGEELILQEEELPPGHGKVLLMDDQEFILEITGEILTALGYQVETAEDGQRAIELYKRAKKRGEPFDIIIMDLTIPGGMGGQEAMQKIRAFDPKVKSIVSSGYCSDPIMSKPEDFGFMGVVSKPYTVRELQAEVHRVLHTDAS